MTVRPATDVCVASHHPRRRTVSSHQGTRRREREPQLTFSGAGSQFRHSATGQEAWQGKGRPAKGLRLRYTAAYMRDPR